MDFRSIRYDTAGRIATITLDRPHHLNAIDAYMPEEIERAVAVADADDAIHVIVVTGEGRAFCAGYDLEAYAEREGPNVGFQEMPWDAMADYRMMAANTERFMSLWRSRTPTIAKVRGYAVGGGSDIALACDLVVMAENAKIGYPPARVWGCPTTAMWVYRIGPERAKRMLFTGDLIDGATAAEWGLVLDAVLDEHLDHAVAALADRIAGVPRNQLMMHKLLVNQAIDAMGLANTQMLATLFDGIARHSPEGIWWKRHAEEVGFRQAVAERDSGAPIAPEVSE